MGGSGWNPSSDKEPPSASRSRSNEHTPRASQRILIVEDNKADVFLILEAIEAAKLKADVSVVQDGEQATELFDRVDLDSSAAPPTLVILDINLPKKHGQEVLAHLRRSARCSNAIVMAVSTSGAEKDRAAMLRLGANGYFHKPSSFDEFLKLGDLLKQLIENGP